jgi:hypothetical protein
MAGYPALCRAVTQTEIEQKASGEGITLDQLKRAKPQVGVDSRKMSLNGGWEWYLRGGRGDTNTMI